MVFIINYSSNGLSKVQYFLDTTDFSLDITTRMVATVVYNFRNIEIVKLKFDFT